MSRDRSRQEAVRALNFAIEGGDMEEVRSVLAQHPLGTDVHAASHYDFLKFLEADLAARSVLDAGLERFPNSWVLHDRLRGQILEE